jgi:hypothetical protein
MTGLSTFGMSFADKPVDCPLQNQRMKKIIFLMLMLCIVGVAWSQTKTPISPQPPKPKKSGVTIEGDFRSVSGVMNSLSCYCSDGGYVTTAAGDRIAVCFEKDEFQTAKHASDKFSCERIRVTGVYKNANRESGENDPCPGGTMRYLAVTKFKCL